MIGNVTAAERLFYAVAAERKTIVVIGDIMRDIWVLGHTEPSQDGCHKFVEDTTKETLGGAGNAAASLGGWTAHVELCGHWNNRRGTKTRFLDNGKVVFRHDNDIIAGPEHDHERKQALEWVRQSDGVLLCDYAKGFLTPSYIAQVTELCRRCGVPCVADVKRGPEMYAGCITKCNDEWYIKYGMASVVTRGALSPSVSGNVIIGVRDMLPVPCVNHVGAGDCFAAHLTLGLAYGLTLEDAAAVAHSAGRVYVQWPLSRPPIPQEVCEDMANAL